VQIKALPRRHYPHAPITEAVIALGYELPPEIRLEDLLKVHVPLKSDYPDRGEQFNVQFQVDTADKVGKTGPSEVVGYRFVSPDGRRVFRVTLNDFAYSQLAPYDRWETLYAEARRIWAITETTLRPRRIKRAAVRFINRIDMPDPENRGVDLDAYFHAAPKIPRELPQLLTAYFVRLEIPFEAPNGVLILTLATAQSPTPGAVSALLDLDTVVQSAGMDHTTAWKAIEELRDVKNAAFEASITDAARELFK
jgi:uncharacterized protein (TIGR04255 family)